MSSSRMVLQATLLLILIPLSSFGRPLHESKAPKNPSIPGELVVRLKDRTSGKVIQSRAFHEIAAALKSRLKIKTAIQTKLFVTDASFAVVSVPESLKSESIVALQSDARVAYAEPNYIMSLIPDAPESGRGKGAVPSPTPNDDLYSMLWGLKNVGQMDAAGQLGRAGADIGVEPIWRQGITGSRNIRVAVIDTGVDYHHLDLKENMWVNPGESGVDAAGLDKATNGIDDDANGFIDDVRGWNFATRGSNPDVPVVANDPMDDHYHGTHCAGTIGAVGNNTLGVTGVNWKVTIVPIKFLDYKGFGSLAGSVQSVQYAKKLGVNIMSNSWGGGEPTQALNDAITEAQAAGITFVAAAGNDADDNDETPSFPSSYRVDNIISVAATDNMDRIARFSNFGAKQVHVAAPGVKTLSTVPAWKGTYKFLSGTSMATPHVSGIAALMLSANPNLTTAEIKNQLIQTSDRTHSLTRKSVSGGRVNIYNAMNGIVPPAPVAPDESLWVDYAWSVETPHPYKENQVYTYSVTVPGAKYIRVVFATVDTEHKFDYLRVTQANGDEIDRLSGLKPGYVTDYLIGDRATVVLESDETMCKSGFKVAKLQVIY